MLLPLATTIVALILLNVVIASWLATAIGAAPAGVPFQALLLLALLGVGAAVGAVVLWRKWLQTPGPR
jgi:hypothetical protein